MKRFLVLLAIGILSFAIGFFSTEVILEIT
jgi:hypothetical protein